MSFLEEIVGSTKARVSALSTEPGVVTMDERLGATLDVQPFAAALRDAPAPALIAEIKRATPSAGILDGSLDAAAQAAFYREGGAAAVSVLTEPTKFLGSVADLTSARSAGLPVLQKDFILDPIQIVQGRAMGADAVLLIVRILEGSQLGELLAVTRDLGMDALIEVFDETDLERALDVGATLIGINHRDLETFEVDPDRTAKLAPLLPPDVTLVSLSGVSTRAEVESLVTAGAKAVLVGTSLVIANDPAAKLKELRGA